LQAEIVDESRSEGSGFPEFGRVGTAMKRASHGRKTGSADDSIGIRVGEVVEIDANEAVVDVIDLMIEAQEAEPASIMADKYAGCERRGDR
jgi:hypothetical protein